MSSELTNPIDQSLFISIYTHFSCFHVAAAIVAIVTINSFVSAQYQHPSQFRQNSGGFVQSIQDENGSDEQPNDSTPAAAVNYRQQSYEYEEEEEQTQPPQTRRQQYIRPNKFSVQPSKQNAIDSGKNQFEEELEPEEPDRLALLLEKSTFNCDERTG